MNRLKKVLVPLALVIGVFAFGASAAQAYTEHHYAGVLLEPGQTWAAPESSHLTPNVTGNIAGYEGEGTVNVCQRTFDFTSGVYREGCANHAVGSAVNLMPYYGHYLWPMVKNNSGFAHTIQGWYYTN